MGGRPVGMPGRGLAQMGGQLGRVEVPDGALVAEVAALLVMCRSRRLMSGVASRAALSATIVAGGQLAQMAWLSTFQLPANPSRSS